MAAIEDLIRLSSIHWFNKLKPSCLSGFQPTAEIACNTFAGKSDNIK